MRVRQRAHKDCVDQAENRSGRATKPQTEPHASAVIPTIRRGVNHIDSTQQGRGRFLPQPIKSGVSPDKP